MFCQAFELSAKICFSNGNDYFDANRKEEEQNLNLKGEEKITSHLCLHFMLNLGSACVSLSLFLR